MKVGKKAGFLGIALALAFAALAGCGTSNEKPAAETQTPVQTGASETPDALPPAKLVWLLRASPQTDGAAVQEAFNKIVKEKINAEVELRFIDGGVYDTKIKTMIAAGETFDLAFASSSLGGDFYGSVAKGAFIPLDDLIKTYAPQTFASIPEDFWEAVTVDKRIYGVPNYQIVARQNGVVVQQRMLDKYAFDLTGVNKLEELEPLLKSMKEGESSNSTPFYMSKAGIWKDMLTYYGFDSILSPMSPGTVKIGDDSLKVINQYTEPSFLEHIKLIRDWYEKGYINKDVATAQVGSTSDGSLSLSMWNNIKPGGNAEMKALVGGNDVAQHVLDRPFVTTANISITLQAISRTSKNPERAMMLIELMNTDKELYNLLSFGIENKHYKKTGADRIEPIADSGYFPNKSWSFGNQFNAYLLPEQPDDVWQQTIDLNNRAERSKLLGFNFDIEPVKAEIAQTQSVLDEYTPGLLTGSVDPEKYLPQFLDRLKAAGADAIIAEKQKQIDAWKASR
ncbi:ABC transporter substrate-binding protein [Cohnella algarum]|uniref:ABC transporter substrate-binding protein n=1 Tax=Cohnella algarum TaxID=2044859 RepID=UPI00196756D4|nr:ABC transporter substrate-binding protein [Cohnella algarum]MBN2984716.1 ABC transporter substrate-binding protein [Cohnella algarum]